MTGGGTGGVGVLYGIRRMGSITGSARNSGGYGYGISGGVGGGVGVGVGGVGGSKRGSFNIENDDPSQGRQNSNWLGSSSSLHGGLNLLTTKDKKQFTKQQQQQQQGLKSQIKNVRKHSLIRAKGKF